MGIIGFQSAALENFSQHRYKAGYPSLCRALHCSGSRGPRHNQESMLTRLIPLLIALCMTSTTAFAGNILLDDPTDIKYTPSAEEDWKEGEVKLPEQVNRDALQAFEVGAGEQRFQYLIDTTSLITGEDGVTRFLLVIRSNSGVDNSSYEGFRCGERLYKAYAYGDANRLFPATDSDWQLISKDESTDYRAALYDDMLCNLLTGKPNDPDEVFRAMRSHRRVSE